MLRIALFILLTLTSAAQARTQTAILAGGCFWCVEANFESLPGVSDVVSGYTGGNSANPTYDDHEGHYEAVKVTFDDAKVSYDQIVAAFLHSTDVVDTGGQFCDRGNAYRSAIFVTNAAQKAAAQAAIAAAGADLGQAIATKILPAKQFWLAEDYHQNYYKGSDIVLTRRGPKSQASAYTFYRDACGRDARVKQLWGSEAVFLH